MTDFNPYTAPKAAVVAADLPEEGLDRLDDKALKKLYYRSCNVTGLAVLLSLGVVVILGVLSLAGPRVEGDILFLMVILAFYCITATGLFIRSSWGRILGIIVCSLSLISIPIGTLIGLMGLFAFFGAPQLFGPNRILHRDLKAEFKLRKKRRSDKR